MDANGARLRGSAFAGVVRLILGGVFLASAVVKLIDFPAFAEQVSYYGIVEDGTYLHVISAATIALEIVLSVALLVGWRVRPVLALTVVVLVGFTALIAYAWAFNNLEECGCFGSFLVMTPAVSIGKNAILLLLTPLAWPRANASATTEPAAQASAARPRSRTKVFMAGCVVGVVLTLALEIAAGVIYVTVFHDRMISNIERKMLAPSPPGTAMPYDWYVRDRTGEQIGMDRFQGTPLFLVFFSPACPKCEAQLPSLERFYRAIKEEEVGFAAISTRESERLEAMLRRQGCTFPVHIIGEERPALFERVHVASVYVFSNDGALIYEQFDAARWDTPAFVAFIRELAAP